MNVRDGYFFYGKFPRRAVEARRAKIGRVIVIIAVAIVLAVASFLIRQTNAQVDYATAEKTKIA